MSSGVITGPYAYFGAADGVHVFDITDPATLHEVALHPTNTADGGLGGEVTDIAIAGGDYLYAALGDRGVRTYRCEGR